MKYKVQLDDGTVESYEVEAENVEGAIELALMKHVADDELSEYFDVEIECEGKEVGSYNVDVEWCMDVYSNPARD